MFNFTKIQVYLQSFLSVVSIELLAKLQDIESIVRITSQILIGVLTCIYLIKQIWFGVKKRKKQKIVLNKRKSKQGKNTYGY